MWLFKFHTEKSLYNGFRMIKLYAELYDFNLKQSQMIGAILTEQEK